MTGIRKLFSALAGSSIFIATAYFSYNVATGMYYNYFLWPKEKAEEHYLRPTRWQDLTFLGIFWAAAFLLFFVSFRLIRFATKKRNAY